MLEYIVKQGDCINSIAFKFGFFPKTIWDHTKNASLKELRKDPSILFEGDRVFIPEKDQKNEIAFFDKRNRFKMKGVPAKLCLKIFSYDNEEMKNASYKLEIGGNITEGKLSSNGVLNISIPPNIKKAKLIVEDDTNLITYILNIGNLDPLETISGIQERLNNLGFDCGMINGQFNSKMGEALKKFQKNHNLEITGKINKETKDKLKEVHGL